MNQTSFKNLRDAGYFHCALVFILLAMCPFKVFQLMHNIYILEFTQCGVGFCIVCLAYVLHNTYTNISEIFL